LISIESQVSYKHAFDRFKFPHYGSASLQMPVDFHSTQPKFRMRALLDLPWWGMLALLPVSMVLFYLWGFYIRWRFEKMCHDAVIEAG